MDILSGYLDVKISARTRRGFTPWKAWQKQWCEIKRVDCIENGVELKLKSALDGNVLSVVRLPRSSKICRTESRTKQYSFGVFTLGRNQKPLLFLSGNSEKDSQAWMSSIRKMLSIASYLPVGETNFHVSLVDNSHSRTAGLMGLYGVLGTNSQEIVISDPCTGEPKITWKWYQFHQFHLQASSIASDENQICVMHTSTEFIAGPGQLYLYCKQAPQLLNYLVARGKRPKLNAGLINTRRLSRSEGDLCEAYNGKDSYQPDSPICFRSNSGSEDSGVRVSLTSEDFALKSKMAASLVSIGMALLTKTPGGSETGDSMLDITLSGDGESPLMRRESGISIASGIYEEISETPPTTSRTKEVVNHVYEDPVFVSLRIKSVIPPPPLPPRQNELLLLSESMNETPYISMTPYKQRCNTLPAKDLQRMSQIFTSDEEYMVMSPTKKTMDAMETYIPMTKIATNLESCYMVMK